MEARRVERLAEGELPVEELDAGERALAELVHKTVVAPARLEAADLRDVAQAYGVSGTMEIVSVLTSFHFINRIADLVGIQSDLPIVQPRWRRLRLLGVRVQAWTMRHAVDLANRDADVDVGACLSEATEVLGALPAGFEQVRQAPNVAAFLTTVTRVARQIDPAILERARRAVVAALPSCEEEAVGFHARPGDPFDALAFVGTRYPVRTTDEMVDAVRAAYGFDDAQLTDVFYAISMHNGIERMNRLLAAPLAAGIEEAPTASRAAGT